MVNTTTNIHGKAREELENLVTPTRHTRHDKHPDSPVNGTAIYDEMIDISEEPMEVEQILEAPTNMYTVCRATEGTLKATKVNYLLVSEGTMWGFVGIRDEVEMASTAETKDGFEGYVIKEGADALSTEEIEQLLNETKIEEDK